MTTVLLCPTFGAGYQGFDHSGAPLFGGFIYTYAAGGTTPKATYTTVAGSVQNANPIQLGADGRPPNEIWLIAGDSYRMDVTDALGNLMASYDNISGILGSYDLSSSSGSTLVGFIQSGTGAIARTVQSKLRESVSVFDFMSSAQIADWQGGTFLYDHSTSIQLALNTGKSVFLPAGNPDLRTMVTISTQGQKVFGEGKSLTKLRIPATFALASAAVFDVASGEPGPELSDFGIYFVQPDTNVYANLISYPTAVLLSYTSTSAAQARTMLRRIRIANAMTAIDARGNNGGTYFEDLELSFYDYGMRIDGALDTVRIINPHFYTFNMTANQSSMFYLSTCIALDVARCDGLVIENGLTICGQGMKLTNSAASAWSIGGNCFGSVSNHDFDGYNGILMSSGLLSVNGSYFSHNAGAYRALNHTGGIILFDGGCKFNVSASTASPIYSNTTTGSITGTHVSINGADIGTMSSTVSTINVSSSIGMLADIQGVKFRAISGTTAPADGFVNIASNARVSFVGNIADDIVGGSGNLLTIVADANHVVNGNNFNGWGCSLPAGYTSISAPGIWASYTPTMTSGTGTITTVGAISGRYEINGRKCTVEIDAVITTNGTGASYINLTLPVAASKAATLSGRMFTGAYPMTCAIGAGSNLVNCFKYDGLYPGADGQQFIISGSYEF